MTILTDRIPLASVLSGDSDIGRGIAERIERGEVFVYPTETIYGVGGRADSGLVEARIKSIKNRSKQTPFILIGADIEQFSFLHVDFPENASRLAKRFWPGNLTLVLPAEGREHGVAIRISNHPFITALRKNFPLPIFSTSANISDRPYVNDPDEMYETFNGLIDFFVDGGVLPGSKPSTVVRVNLDGAVEILREGNIPRNEILQAAKG